MLPASPAFFSCRAHQEIRWSAARTSAGGSSRPASAAFPLNPRPTAAPGRPSPRPPAASAPSPARPPSPRGRSRTAARPASAARPAPAPSPRPPGPPPGSSMAVAQAMICALACRSVPARNAALVPGSLTSRSRARSSIPSAVPRPSASSWAISSPANSSRSAGSRAGPSAAQPGAGRRRVNSASAACLREHAVASARSSAPITPASSSSLAPANRSPAPAASSAKPSSTPPPGATSSGCPVPNPPAGPAYSPGTRRAEPGIPGPRRPTLTPACGTSASRGQPRRPLRLSGLLRGPPGGDPPRLRPQHVQVHVIRQRGIRRIGAPPGILLGIGRRLAAVRRGQPRLPPLRVSHRVDTGRDRPPAIRLIDGLTRDVPAPGGIRLRVAGRMSAAGELLAWPAI